MPVSRRTCLHHLLCSSDSGAHPSSLPTVDAEALIFLSASIEKEMQTHPGVIVRLELGMVPQLQAAVSVKEVHSVEKK